jgi:hypothetical protein
MTVMAKKKKARKTEKFQVWAYYDGYDWEMDDRIRKAAGKDDFGTGFGGLRDLSFFAQNESHALRMKDRILKVKGVVRVEVINHSKGDSDGYMVYAKAGSKGTFRRYPCR